MLSSNTWNAMQELKQNINAQNTTTNVSSEFLYIHYAVLHIYNVIIVTS